MPSEIDSLFVDDGAPKEAERSQSEFKPALFLSAAFACFGNIAFGFDVGSYGGVLTEVEESLDLSTIQTEIVIGQFYLGCALGGLCAGSIADYLGRRAALVASCILFIVGITLQIAAEDVASLLIGRLVAGAGAGVSWVAGGIYVSEIAPAKLRGYLVVIVDIAINVGLVLGYVAALGCWGTYSWRVVVGMGMFFPIVLVIALNFMPESPRWIMLQDETPSNLKLARENLLLLEPTPEDASARLEELRALKSGEHESTVPFEKKCAQLMASPAAWGAMLIGIAMGAFQQWSGTEAILYYSSDMLEAAGFTSTLTILWWEVAVAICKLLGEVISQLLVDHVGRRPLLLLSGSLTVLGFGSMGFSYGLGWSDISKPIILCIIMFVFSLGAGPLTLVCVCEISPTRHRASIVATSVFCNRMMSGTVAYTYLSMIDWLGDEASVFAVYTSLALVSVIFYYLTIPEMAQVSLDSKASYLPPFYRYLTSA